MEEQYIEMYEKLPGLIFGFHGCSLKTYQNVLYEGKTLKKSENKYDWLGNGIYFWENSYSRALEWARKKYCEDAAVVGAIIDLGCCLNLTDYHSSEILKKGYELLSAKCRQAGVPIPQNGKENKRGDVLLRDLDCAVIQQLHTYNQEQGKTGYDSVRGVFWEGEEIYPGSGFREKTHTQLCIVNPNCIKGYFRPVESDEKFSIP